MPQSQFSQRQMVFFSSYFCVILTVGWEKLPRVAVSLKERNWGCAVSGREQLEETAGGQGWGWDSWQVEQLEDTIFPGCIADGVLCCVLGTG